MIKITTVMLEKGFEYLTNEVTYKPYRPHGVSKDVPIMPVFKKPVEISLLSNKKTYRVIARYPNYAISEDSELINLKFYHRINFSLRKDHSGDVKKGYYYANIYDPLREKNNLVAVHRLVAMAWCENDDYVKRNLVDHIDSNKLNNHRTNLIWASNASNQSYISTNGIRGNFIALNLMDGTTLVEDGLATLLETLGLSRGTSLVNNLPVYKYVNNNLWYVTKITDEMVTLLSLDNAKPGFGMIVRNLTDGKTIFYRNKNEFRNRHGVSLRDKRVDVYKTIIVDKDKKELLFYFLEESTKSVDIEVYSYTTNKFTKYTGYETASKGTGILAATIASGLRRQPDGFKIGDYAFRFSTTIKWEVGSKKSTRPNLKIVYENNDVVVVKSWREAERVIGRDMKTIKKNMDRIFSNKSNSFLRVEKVL